MYIVHRNLNIIYMQDDDFRVIILYKQINFTICILYCYIIDE